MTAVSKDYIRGIVEKVAYAHNLTDLEYSEKKFINIAQNFFGLLIPLTLKAKQHANAVNIELVLKLAPTDERYRISGAVTLMFACEIFVYTNLLEKYRVIQEQFPSNLKHLMPRCYYVCEDYCNEAIAMDNMCGHGYEPFTSSTFLDYDHTVVSLEALAKFHALSFILRERDVTMFEEVEKKCVPFTQATNNRFMLILLDRLQKAIDNFENEPNYLGILKSMKDNCIAHVEAAAYSIQQKCICHGDIWKENILYKYNENHRPIAACLIDYQTVRISSAAYDTLFFLTTSTNTSLRGNPKGTFHKLLEIYYKKFSDVICASGLDSAKVYSRKMFDTDIKVVAPGSFIIANTALWLSSGLQQEGHVRSKQVFNSNLEKEEAASRYRQIIKDIINDYISYGYFCSLKS